MQLILLKKMKENVVYISRNYPSKPFSIGFELKEGEMAQPK